TEESLKKHREGVKEAMMQHRKDVLKLAGNTGMMLLGMVIFLFTVSGGTLWYLGGQIQANLEEIRIQEETLQKLNAKTWGVEFVQDGRRKFLVIPQGKSATVIPYQGNERDLAIEAKHSNKRYTRIAPVCVLTRSCFFSKV
ncbi:hypothetical protein AWH01_00470, partial [Escherichia coli]